MSDDDEREYLIAWELTRPGDEDGWITVTLWENSEDVTVFHNRDAEQCYTESRSDGEEEAEGLLAKYRASGYEVHRDPPEGYNRVKFYDEA